MYTFAYRIVGLPVLTVAQPHLTRADTPHIHSYSHLAGMVVKHRTKSLFVQKKYVKHLLQWGFNKLVVVFALGKKLFVLRYTIDKFKEPKELDNAKKVLIHLLVCPCQQC